MSFSDLINEFFHIIRISNVNENVICMFYDHNIDKFNDKEFNNLNYNNTEVNKILSDIAIKYLK